MLRLALLGAVALLLTLACGQEPTRVPTRTPTAKITPTPLPTGTPTPTSTRRPRIRPTVVQAVPRATTARLAVPAPTSAGPITSPATPEPTAVVRNAGQARNFTWVYLSRCASFEPGQLVTYQVKGDWFVKAQTNSRLDFGIWKVDSQTGDLEPHDVKSREWQPYIESSCSPEIAAVLFPVTPMPTITVAPSPAPTRTPPPTRTPTPIPTATPVVPNTADAVASVWSYLVKCFPKAELADFKAVLDPVNDQYVVKDNDEIQYGVWRVDQDDGDIVPDNAWAKGRDQIVRGGTC